MGERHNQPFQFSFNAALKVDFQGSRVTSDGGLSAIRTASRVIVEHFPPRRKVSDVSDAHIEDLSDVPDSELEKCGRSETRRAGKTRNRLT